MAKNKKIIYLDYAATTPIDPEVLGAMLPYFKKNYGNPSSIYGLGQEAQMAIDRSRERVSRFLNCQPSEVIFSGSATEANNLAIFGVVRAAQKNGIKKPHIITTEVEHHAILEPCKELEKRGVEVTFLPVSKEGLAGVAEVKKAIKNNTVLVSIMYANNEIGTVQPIAEIGKLIQKVNSSNSQSRTSNIYFHTDAVQAINYLDCDVKKLAVDLLTLSGHKIYGPKGIGALYVKQDTEILPLIYGGGQEEGMRSGTENVAGIIGLAEAIKQVSSFKIQVSRIKKLRDRLIDRILKNIPDSRLNGSREKRLPNNINVSISGIEGESMVIALDGEGIAASTGSACSSRSLEPSHVLLALGLGPKEAHGSLRLTLGRYTTEKEIDKVSEVLPKIVQRLRKISPFK